LILKFLYIPEAKEKFCLRGTAILMNLFFGAIIPEKSDWLSGKPERFPCFVRARPDEKINLLLQK